MKVFEKIMYPIFIFMLAYAVYTSKTNLALFEETMVADDGMFQWTIFGTLLFASIMCFYRAGILKPFRGMIFSSSQKILGWVFLVFACDEVSWFQRVIGFSTPEFFLTHNTREQFNLHHLVLANFHINNIIFTLAVKIIATLYFLVFPFLYNRIEKLKTFFDKYGIPLPRYTQTAAYSVLALMVTLIPSEYNYVVFEFGFYWLLVLMMYNPINDEVFSRKSLVR
jgi:hypothetical protein